MSGVGRASADVDAGAAGGVGLGLAEHLTGDRRDLAVADQQEPQQIAQRLPSVQLK